MASSFTKKRYYEKPGDGDSDWGSGYNRNFDALEEDLSHTGSKFKKALNRENVFSSRERWEQLDMRSAQGGGTTADNSFVGMTFDGKYLYYPAQGSDTFIRFDTTGNFRDITSWEQMRMSSAQGAAALDDAYIWANFDGRYVYYGPHDADTFIRYDTSGAFTDITAWEQMALSSGQGGGAVNNAFSAVIFDGKYIYYCPQGSDTFVRFDTTEDFDAIASWEQIRVISGMGANVALPSSTYLGATFDGRYVYYAASFVNTAPRFDTTGDFTDITSWEQIAVSSSQGGARLDQNFFGACFDGRHVYFNPDNGNSMVRFDVLGTFTDITDWEQIALASAQGAAAVDDSHAHVIFDGRYLYYSAKDSATFIRYDSTADFTDITSWQQVNQGSAQGSAATLDGYTGCGFDGYYVYFCPTDSDTFIRFRANTTPNPSPTEYGNTSS